MFHSCDFTDREMPEYSAVCAYRIQDIRDVFSKGQFKVLNSDALLRKSVTYDGPLPDPRPGAVGSTFTNIFYNNNFYLLADERISEYNRQHYTAAEYSIFIGHRVLINFCL